MYSPDDQGEYTPEVGVLSFPIQGLSDVLAALETVTEVQPCQRSLPYNLR